MASMAPSGEVDVIAAQGNSLYAGGQFTTIGQGAVNYVADWNLSAGTWSGLGEGITPPDGDPHAFVDANCSFRRRCIRRWLFSPQQEG